MTIAIPKESRPLIFESSVFRDGNHIEILRDGAQAYPRMLGDIQSALGGIQLEMYAFASDQTGWSFARALVGRAMTGVPVQVIYDSFGSRNASSELFRYMSRHQAITLYEYSPTLPRHWSLWWRRDHRKVLIVDGRVGYVGGMNVSDDYASVETGGGGWHDTMARIEGPIVYDLHDAFQGTWSGSFFRHRAPVRISLPDERLDGTVAAVIGAKRWRDRRSIAHHYYYALSRARHRIWITNAYFILSRPFLRAIREACQRGVDVRLLLPFRSNEWPAVFASGALFQRLLDWGVRIFMWKGPMLHSKTAVIDGAWSMIGSFNLDHLSLLQNLEVALIALGSPVGSKMEAMFEEDQRSSPELTSEIWKSRACPRRFLERACYALRLLL